MTDPATYIVAALRAHRLRVERNGGAVPRLAVDLEAAFSARHGQERPTFGDSVGPGDSDRVSPLLLDYDAAGSALSLSERTIRRLVREGRLPAVKVGGSMRIKTVDLDAFVAGLPIDSRGGSAPVSLPPRESAVRRIR